MNETVNGNDVFVSFFISFSFLFCHIGRNSEGKKEDEFVRITEIDHGVVPVG